MPDADAAILQRLEVLERESKKHEHVLLGNGRPGLIQDVARMNASVEFMRTTAEELKREALVDRKERAAFNREILKTLDRVKLAVQSIERDGANASLRMKQVESMLGPIVDWKKGIIIRVTTTAAVLSFLVAAAAFIIENWASIKAWFAN